MLVVVFLFWYFVRYVGLIAIGYTALLLVIQTLFGRLFLRIRFVTLRDEDRMNPPTYRFQEQNC